MRTIARTSAAVATGLLLGSAIFVGGMAQGESTQRQAQQPIVSTEHAPAPTQTVTQRVPGPVTTTTVTAPAPAPKTVRVTTKVRVKVPGPTKTVTKLPFCMNPGDAPEEDSCHPDYIGQDQDKWVMKKGERPARATNRNGTLPDDSQPETKPATRQQVQSDSEPTEPEPTPTTEPTPTADPNGPQPGNEHRLPVPPQHSEPPVPDVR